MPLTKCLLYPALAPFGQAANVVDESRLADAPVCQGFRGRKWGKLPESWDGIDDIAEAKIRDISITTSPGHTVVPVSGQNSFRVVHIRGSARQLPR